MPKFTFLSDVILHFTTEVGITYFKRFVLLLHDFYRMTDGTALLLVGVARTGQLGKEPLQ